MASYRDFLPAVATGDWVRPSDWLPMPTVTSAEQKFVGLHGVWENGDNVVAFLFAGNYTVDWGDGVVENVASGVKAEHQYSWASIPAGTTTSQGYRQVIITVTPQVGQNLTSCNFQQRFTARNQIYTTGFLDVTLSMPNASAGASITFGGVTVAHGNAERVNVLTIGGCTSMANMFILCRSLVSIPLFDTSAVTSMSSTFSSCISLKTVPLFNTVNVATMFNMFNACSSLAYVPLFDMTSNISMTQMFINCTSLQSVPLFNTSIVISMQTAFQNCSSLQSLPALSTAGITTTAGTDFGVNFASGASTLARCEMVFARTVGFGSAGLGAPALVEIFTNLVDRSATTAATITITGNWGAPLLTAGERAIATGKNWTITG
jgi:hypothetical protein